MTPLPRAPVAPTDPSTWVRALEDSGLRRADPVGLALHPRGGVALVTNGVRLALPAAAPAGRTLPGAALDALAAVELALRPRWVWWSSSQTATALVQHGVRPALCWDVAAVHRLLAGGADDGPGTVWAVLNGLDVGSVPRTGQLDLLAPSPPDVRPVDQRSVSPAPRVAPTDGADATDETGHLRAEWVAGGWGAHSERLLTWAELAVRAAEQQRVLLRARSKVTGVSGDPLHAAHAESAAALLCVELAHDGLPLDLAELARLLHEAVGPRPDDATHAAELRRRRDDLVLTHVPEAERHRVDLRNPAHVRAALASVGIDVPDTRSWRLEPWREHHPLVGALLSWRKTDRIATTYGYDWIDRFVGTDHRLRGDWQASDGSAGRMTAGAGLHNLPAELRSAVAGEPGHVLVRADLGQIEPRVLAAVSGDPALTAATADDDLYAPVAARLRVERSVAKIAVLAAMYGQTSGTAGEALRGLERAYPVAMGYLRRASEQGRRGEAVHTHGGRRVPMWGGPPPADEDPSRAAARGRYARNAVVQGSAAELFKAWAVTVRRALRPLDAHVVLCLHDELLVHAPREQAASVEAVLHSCLDEAAARWAPGSGVRFVADVRVVERWSQAKG